MRRRLLSRSGDEREVDREGAPPGTCPSCGCCGVLPGRRQFAHGIYQTRSSIRAMVGAFAESAGYRLCMVFRGARALHDHSFGAHLCSGRADSSSTSHDDRRRRRWDADGDHLDSCTPSRSFSDSQIARRVSVRARLQRLIATWRLGSSSSIGRSRFRPDDVVGNRHRQCFA